jgi:perosamine synthetase
LTDHNEFIPLAVPDLRGNELKYLTECVEDNWVSSAGPHVVDLEKIVAELSGCEYGVATVNGTSAIHLALISVGVQPGDKVLVPDWTFAASANAICHAGAVPYFVDIEPWTWTLSPDLVEKALEADKNHREISAVLAVHVLGHPADMERLTHICEAADVPLIEDAAGAIGATYKDKPVGGLGQVGTFSFNGNKTATAGGGGMIVTNNQELATRARHLSTQARTGNDYNHDEIGFNYRMTNVNAAIGLAQIERLNEMVDSKKRIAKVYNEAFKDLNSIQPMPAASWANSSCWLYSIRLPDTTLTDSLMKALGQKNIGARKFWHALSRQKAYSDFPVLRSGAADQLTNCIVSLPCSSQLEQHNQLRVIKTVLDWHQSHGSDIGQSS